GMIPCQTMERYMPADLAQHFLVYPQGEGRDRSAARTTVGGEFPALALSIREVGASFHHGPRFRRPPCDPGQWAFPSPVLTLASRRSPSHTGRSLSAASHPPLHAMVCFH